MGAKTGLKLNNIRGEVYYKGFIVLLSSFLVAFITAGILSPVESSDAITCTSGDTGTEGEICSTAGTDVSVTIEETVYSISVSSSHGSGSTPSPISLDYSSSDVNLGNVLVASDTVTTASNSPLDHYLYISTNSSSNKLTNEDSTDSNTKTFIAPGGGNTIDTAEALTNDTWGFALPSTTSGIPANSFDSSYSSVSNDSKFTKVPTLDNDLLIQKEVGEIDEDTGLNTSTADIYYGTKATSNLFAGTYENTIKYTVYTEFLPMTLTIDEENIEVSSSSIIIPYTLSGSGEVLCEYGTNTNYGTSVTGADGKCTLENLETETTYYYRLTPVVGNNIVGDSQAGEKTTERGIVYLYKDGEEYKDITGGWEFFTDYGSGGYVKKESTYMEMYPGTKTCPTCRHEMLVGTKNNVISSSSTTVHLKYDLTSQENRYSFGISLAGTDAAVRSWTGGICPNGTAYVWFTYVCSTEQHFANSSTPTTTDYSFVGLSEDAGLWFVAAYYPGGSSPKMRIYEVWLEY